MLKKMLAAALVCGIAAAAPYAAPAPAPQTGAAENALVPTADDMARARELRESGKAPQAPSQYTEVRQVRDQNNRVVEYVVTPGSTHIPYTIENRSERPADDTPGHNSKSTTGTTRQIRIGW